MPRAANSALKATAKVMIKTNPKMEAVKSRAASASEDSPVDMSRLAWKAGTAATEAQTQATGTQP